MSITLNHTIVPTHEKEAAARFFAEVFGLRFDGVGGHFAPVRVNDTLTLDFADAAEPIASHHYAFHVSDAEFDVILQRVQAAGESANDEQGDRGHLRLRGLASRISVRSDSGSSSPHCHHSNAS